MWTGTDGECSWASWGRSPAGRRSIDVKRRIVLDDVNERYVSREKAEALYGVVITGSVEDDDLAVDLAATESLRGRMAAGG